MGKRKSGYKKRPLSVSILNVSRFIIKYPGVYVRAISQNMNLPVSTVHAAVERLHSLGLLEKRPIISADIPLPNSCCQVPSHEI